MAIGSAKATLRIVTTDQPGGSAICSPAEISIATPAYFQRTVHNLTGSNNVITIPGVGTATMAVIIPPTANAQTLGLAVDATAGAATALALSPSKWTVLSLASSVTALWLKAGGTINNVEIWWI